MNTDIHQQLEFCSAHRKPREAIRDYILKYPAVFPNLVQMAFEIDYKFHFKACWIVELVADKRLDWLQPHLDFFCNHLKMLKDESAIRPMAKVGMLLVKSNSNDKSQAIKLSESQLEKLTEICFDWLISETKVAAKAYAIRTLFTIGKKHHWVYPELKIVLEKDYQYHTAAYKAVAREILKKLKSLENFNSN